MSKFTPDADYDAKSKEILLISSKKDCNILFRIAKDREKVLANKPSKRDRRELTGKLTLRLKKRRWVERGGQISQKNADKS